jgi:hypothetical protein
MSKTVVDPFDTFAANLVSLARAKVPSLSADAIPLPEKKSCDEIGLRW